MSSSSSPCAACKLLRRKCTQGCVFAPYFPPDQPARFANVHKVFGASNVSKLLNDLPQSQREDAVNSLAYEAEARLRDPVYGCVAYISILQLKIKQVRDDINNARKELAAYIGPAAFSQGVPTQYATGMGLGVGIVQPQQHQQMALQQHPYHQVHQQQIVDAQHMAAAVEVAREQQQQQQQQDMMMMRQGYAVPGAAGAPTVAVVPPGSAEAAAYEGASYLIQQQPPSSALTYRMELSPPPQSSGTHADMSHAQQQGQQHMDGSDERSGSAVPPA